MSNSLSPNADDLDDRPEVEHLFKKLNAALTELEHLLEECTGQLGYEDSIYRFYHQSFKVYQLQRTTLEIVETLQSLKPDRTLDQWFMQIVAEGTGKTFTMEDNENWPGV